MHIKFLSHGKGSGVKAISYLLQKKDHKGELRDDVEVLRGNPKLTATAIDSLVFKQRYSSCVIAFAPEDKPTRAQMLSVVDDFRRSSFSGMDENDFSWIAIKHSDQNGGVHIHVVTARVDLKTGRSFNPAPPGGKTVFDHMRDMYNYKNGWARPDDPSRARLYQPGHRLYLEKGNPKEKITDFLIKSIQAGLITDRKGVERHLSEIGEITRIGKDYISVKPDGFTRALRLKGGIFSGQFNASFSGFAGEQDKGSSQSCGRDNRERAEDAKRLFEEAIAKRSKYNRERYRKSERKHLNSNQPIGRSISSPKEINNKAISVSSGTTFFTADFDDCGSGGVAIISNGKSNRSGQINSEQKISNDTASSPNRTNEGTGFGSVYGKIETTRFRAHKGVEKPEWSASDIYGQQKCTDSIPEQGRLLGHKAIGEKSNDRNKTTFIFGVRGDEQELQRRRRGLIWSNDELRRKTRNIDEACIRFRGKADRFLNASERLNRTIRKSIESLSVKRKLNTSKKFQSKMKFRWF